MTASFHPPVTQLAVVLSLFIQDAQKEQLRRKQDDVRSNKAERILTTNFVCLQCSNTGSVI
jgi:hypothetical protein